MKKITEILNYGMGFLFLVMITIGLLAQLMPDKAFSEKENRVLEGVPQWTLASYMSGDFQRGMSSYTNDQFPLRSQWVERKTELDLLSGQRKFKDVYVGSDDILMQEYAPMSADKSIQLYTAINGFYTRYPNINTSVMVVPNKIQIESDCLPTSAPVKSQKKDMDALYAGLQEGIHGVDVRSVLQAHKSEYMYYKSDHHWTMKAAKYAFDAFLPNSGFEDKQVKYKKHISNNGFYGTLANRIGYYKERDRVDIYLPSEGASQYMVTFKDTGVQRPSLYDSSKQLSSSAYDVFLGGNSPYIEINTTVENDRHLLLFKDSYANSFVEYLLPYYSTITMIDPRYYYDDINALVEREQVSDVLYLYNANTLFSQDSLEQVITSK